MNHAPTPKNFALGSLEIDVLMSGDTPMPVFFNPSRFELIVNPLPIVPVAIPLPPCGCADDELVEEEAI
jgi:hypothetical protein